MRPRLDVPRCRDCPAAAGGRPAGGGGRRVAALRRRHRGDEVLAARPDRHADNVGSLRIAWRRPAVDRSILEQVPNLTVHEQPDEHAADGRRHRLRLERRGPGRGVGPGHRGDHLDPGADGPGAPGVPRGGDPRRRLLDRRQRRAHPRAARPVPHRAQREDRRAVPGLRGRRPRAPHDGARAGRPLPLDGGAAGGRRRRGGGPVDDRHVHHQGGGARAGQGVRRADRRAALDVPHGPAGGGVRHRHLGWTARGSTRATPRSGR